jgi:hypothetical protein
MAYHVQITQRPDVAAAFNLSEQGLRRDFLEPMQAGDIFVYADKEWDPRRAKLTILEGRELYNSELMTGLGWGNAVKQGTDVTEAVMSTLHARPKHGPVAERLKDRIVGRLSGGALPLPDVVTIADDLLEGHRVSERLAAAETAVWELLHEGHAQLELGDGVAVAAKDEWQPLLLSADSWLGDGGSVRLIAA